jgi:molybdate transport system substrate-binding protein
MQDLVKLERIRRGKPQECPGGRLCVQAIKKAGNRKQLEGKLVLGKDVRECLMYADRGEVTGCLRLQDGCRADGEEREDPLHRAQELYPRVTYPLGITAAGAKKPEAVAYFKFAQSPEGKKILAKHGFVVE